jgi:segregation and condensation protein B
MSGIREDDLPGVAGSALPGGVRAAVEAVLMVSDDPVPLPLVAAALSIPVEDVLRVVDDLAAEYDRDERGFELRATDTGWRIWSRRELAPVVRRFVAEAGPPRLSRAALETLAIIAYRQPVTRSALGSIRGVSVDAVIRTLLSRGLVEEVGTDPATGAALFSPTVLLYEKLGIRGPGDLPPLAPFLPEVGEVDDDDRRPAARGEDLDHGPGRADRSGDGLPPDEGHPR